MCPATDVKSDIAAIQKSEVRVATGDVTLEGTLSVPRGAGALVAFAHGSGSSRFSPRNRHVATTLNDAGLATLLFDLLTADEEEVDRRTRELRFDIGLLAERLAGGVRWARRADATRAMKVGLFGSSTGAAAALIVAARYPAEIGAVVSRGGRPDLAGDALPAVRAPTLLIVGGNDVPVIALNREAAARMSVPPRLEIVPRATHLFEEPGTLDEVARLAAAWFVQELL